MPNHDLTSKLFHFSSTVLSINSGQPPMHVQKGVQINDFSNEIIQNQKSSLQEMIQNVFRSAHSLNETLLLPLSKNLYFKLDITKTHLDFCIEGELIFLNGIRPKMGQSYKINIIRNLNKKIKNGVTFLINDQRLIFQIRGKLKFSDIDQNIRNFPYNTIVQKIIEALRLLRIQLNIFGIEASTNSKSFKVKQKQLKLARLSAQIINKKVQNADTSQFDQKQHECILKQCIQIRKKEEQQIYYDFEDEKNISSNFFDLQKGQFEIKVAQKQEIINRQLVTKTLNKKHQDKKYKLDRQINIIKQIESAKHSIAYWFSQKHPQTLFMQYQKQNMDDIIYGYENSINESLDLCKQLADAVAILQSSGIVHRDLKPDNIIVKNTPNNKRIVKIIDFGESAKLTENFQEIKSIQILGSTVPYSPPQTLYHSEKGFNKKQIDYWSLGILIFELVFKYCPLNFHRSFGRQGYKSCWESPDEFVIFTGNGNKKGIKRIEGLINMISNLTIKIRQNDRICTKKIIQLLKIGEDFLQQLLL